MIFLSGAVYVVGLLATALGAVYVAKGVRADLLLLGAAVLLELIWLVECLGLAVRHATGPSGPPDAVLLWGYLLTGAALPVGGVWVAVIERTRWGAAAVTACCLVVVILQLRIAQIWPAVFG